MLRIVDANHAEKYGEILRWLSQKTSAHVTALKVSRVADRGSARMEEGNCSCKDLHLTMCNFVSGVFQAWVLES